MQRKIIWALVALVVIAAPAVIGLVALGGDNSSSARRAGALVQSGTGGYELKIANLPPTGEALKIDSYSWGGSATSSIATGIARSTAPVSTELSVARKVDSASPLLIKGLVGGTRYPTATLTLYKGGEKPLRYIEYKMTDVVISSVQHSGSADDVPTENVTLAFARIETLVEDSQDGKVQASNTFGWNIAALKQ